MTTFPETACLVFGLLAASIFSASAQTADDTNASSVIAPGAKLEKLSSEFSFTEGPTCDPAGNLYFTDQPNDRIMKRSLDGTISEWMKPAGRANGMYMDTNGNLIVCADEKNELWRIAPDKTVTKLITNYEGKYMNGPNDVWITPSGDMYITDPFYARTYWDHQTMALDKEEVYFLSGDGKTFKRVTDDLKKPNGITGWPDGKTLYVADIGANQTWRYDIQPDGSLTNKTLFCHKGSDGMTIDEMGNIYICNAGGVFVFDKTGKQVEQFHIRESWTANVSFGGPDHKTLFITASKSLYSIALKYKGANPAK